jgi:tRNA nucleotidyltransferase (CCA-adding enzyme)
LLAAAQRVDTAGVAQAAQQQGLRGPAVGEAIRAARINAVAAQLALT